ncbi:hypothetical protein OESDEN_17160 [Oesophagostomum dentatum]|uniref:SXP/RAL-2 family protein Ani s 5-like cation-binding domain-containing protein n=1 Tax=Oesophagostomum dentatum TaxID=61180 RepID=A0A0B1SD05_OESDE|nr:hypothetical protein OESDEN_17160 [Oesophagostomum dentatum]
MRTASLFIAVAALFILPSGYQALEEIPFLKGLPKKALNEYAKIEISHNITQRQRKYKLLSWADKYGVKKQVEQFHKQEEEIATTLDKKVEEYLKTHADRKVYDVYRRYLKLNDKFKTDYEIAKEDKKFWKGREKEFKIIEAAYDRFDPQTETVQTQRNSSEL